MNHLISEEYRYLFNRNLGWDARHASAESMTLGNQVQGYSNHPTLEDLSRPCNFPVRLRIKYEESLLFDGYAYSRREVDAVLLQLGREHNISELWF